MATLQTGIIDLIDTLTNETSASIRELELIFNESIDQQLELVLIDKDLLDLFLDHLQDALNSPYPRFELIEHEELQKVLHIGIRALSPERKRQLVLDPIVLLGLRDSVFESMPEYWWKLIRKYMNTSPSVENSPTHKLNRDEIPTLVKILLNYTGEFDDSTQELLKAIRKLLHEKKEISIDNLRDH